MKIPVQFFAQLRDLTEVASTTVELAEGSNISALLNELYVRYPKLRTWNKNILVGAGVEFVERNYVVNNGDEIAIMPPVQGG